MGTLMMAMTIGGVILAIILLIAARVMKKDGLKYFVWGGVTTWFAAYIFLLFCGSFFSVERTLVFNEPKEFCGFYFDCHLHTAVTGVRKVKTFGNLTAQNEFYIVKIKVFSDAKRESLALVTPKFTVVDAAGRKFEPTEDLSVSLPVPPFEEKIPAGGNIEGEVAFDLPSDVQNPRLDIREGYGIDHAIEAVLIGDEDSIGHKRDYFSLENQTQTANVR